MRIKRQTRFDLCENIFTRKMVIARTWIRKKWYATHECKPQGGWDIVARADEDQIRRKRTPSLPIHESIIPRSAQKTKVVENYQYTSAQMRERLKLFFAQLFLLISSVFTEQSQICVENTNPAMLQQGDLFW